MTDPVAKAAADRYWAARRLVRQSDIYRVLHQVGRATERDANQLFEASETYEAATRREHVRRNSPQAQARRLVASLLEG